MTEAKEGTISDNQRGRRKCRYTPQSLEEARERLAIVEEHDANYTGNNPNKYRSEIQEALAEVQKIERTLKEHGLLEATEHELASFALERGHRYAKSGEIVEYNGNLYRRRYSPLSYSRSRKTVTRWGRYWDPVTR